MHDLHTIHRLNAEACDKAKTEAPAKFLVGEYAGVNYLGTTEHDSYDDALIKFNEINARNDSSSATLLFPGTQPPKLTFHAAKGV